MEEGQSIYGSWVSKIILILRDRILNYNVYHLSNPRPLPVHLPAIRVVLVHGAIADGMIPGHATNLHLRGSACQKCQEANTNSVREKLY